MGKILCFGWMNGIGVRDFFLFNSNKRRWWQIWDLGRITIGLGASGGGGTLVAKGNSNGKRFSTDFVM